jgi:hypothetical protein
VSQVWQSDRVRARPTACRSRGRWRRLLRLGRVVLPRLVAPSVLGSCLAVVAVTDVGVGPESQRRADILREQLTAERVAAASGRLDPKDPGKFVVPMGRVVGTYGEQSVTRVVRPGTSEIITGFPS